MNNQLTKALISKDVLAAAVQLGLTITIERSTQREKPDVLAMGISYVGVGAGRGAALASDSIAPRVCGGSTSHAVADYAAKQGIDESDILWYSVHQYEDGRILLNTTPYASQSYVGISGFVFASKQAVRDEFGVSRISNKLSDIIKNRIDAKLEVLSQWANGQVYDMLILDGEDVICSELGVVLESKNYLDHVAKQLLEEVCLDVA